MSSLELVDACLGAAAKWEPRVNAFVTLTAESARSEALAADREIAAGRYRGPLHGIPLAVKDLFATRGVRTTAGSRILADWIPERDAVVVARLRDAGAVMLGKLGLHEFAYGISSVNPHFGDVHNPYDTTRIPGGSSGGSAVAVVTGEALATLGSDTGGSVRIPASLCGCVGLKPTYGAVSLDGAIPLSWSLDHAGPLAHTARDAAILMGAIAADAASLRDEIDAGPKGLRVGVPRQWVWDECDAGIARAVRAAIDALADAGALVREINWPRAAEYARAAAQVLAVEARAYHDGTYPGRAADYGPLVAARLATVDVSAEAYADAMRLLVAARSGMADADLDGVDVLAMPTVPWRPWTIAEAKEIGRPSEWTRTTRIFDLTGQPAVSVPCGLDAGGVPIGLQLAGRSRDERSVLRAAHAYEEIRGPFAPPEIDRA